MRISDGVGNLLSFLSVPLAAVGLVLTTIGQHSIGAIVLIVAGALIGVAIGSRWDE